MILVTCACSGKLVLKKPLDSHSNSSVKSFMSYIILTKHYKKSFWSTSKLPNTKHITVIYQHSLNTVPSKNDVLLPTFKLTNSVCNCPIHSFLMRKRELFASIPQICQKRDISISTQLPLVSRTIFLPKYYYITLTLMRVISLV